MIKFFNADEAAAELQQLTQKNWTSGQVLRATKAGCLPVCFNFVGELVVHSVDGRPEPGGTSPRVLDFDGVVRCHTQPTADGICSFCVLVEIQEVHTLKFSDKDGKRTRGIDFPTEHPHGGRIKAGHKVECWIEYASFAPCDFLFHIEDLFKLVSASQALPSLSKITQVPMQPQTAPAVTEVDTASNAPVWIVTRPKRYSGYAAPLYKFLAAAQCEGGPCPTARDVVEAWRIKKPAEIAQVLPNGFDYYDSNGNTKATDLNAIRKAIGRMTSVRQAPAKAGKHPLEPPR